MDKPIQQRRRVLVVEDERASREAMQGFLRFCGHDVVAAEDPAGALALADETLPHVVVCDCNLVKKLDGIDVARTIQNRYGASVVFVTAHSQSSLSDQIRDIEIAGFLRKPISLLELEDVINNAQTSAR